MAMFLKILLIALMLMTLFFLGMGFAKVGRDSEKKSSNKMMTWRIWAQAGAFLVLALLLYMKR